MDTPRASPAESRETIEHHPTISVNQSVLQSEMEKLQSENRTLKKENSDLRAGMQELRQMVQELTSRLSTVEQHGTVLQNAAINTNESLRRIRRKVDWMAEDLAVASNEFDLGRYDM